MSEPEVTQVRIVVMIPLFIRRFLRRLRYTFRLLEMWQWDNESCARCGLNYRIVMWVRTEKWLEVNGKEKGCLCPSCFFQIAQEKMIKISYGDIVDLWIFDPGGKYSFDIIRGGVEQRQLLSKEDNIIKLTTNQCMTQLNLYAESNENLGNQERAQGFRLAADFLRSYHQDL